MRTEFINYDLMPKREFDYLINSIANLLENELVECSNHKTSTPQENEVVNDKMWN